MSDKLNVQQEKFIQGIINGLSQRQAYKEAYSPDYDDNSIDINASKLFNSTKVQLRYKELLQELQDNSIMTAKERMIWLSGVIKGLEAKTYMGDKLKAVDILNKMSGEYTTKVEHSGSINNPYKDLSLEELKKLAGE